jgi:hypothetical protein
MLLVAVLVVTTVASASVRGASDDCSDDGGEGDDGCDDCDRRAAPAPAETAAAHDADDRDGEPGAEPDGCPPLCGACARTATAAMPTRLLPPVPIATMLHVSTELAHEAPVTPPRSDVFRPPRV